MKDFDSNLQVTELFGLFLLKSEAPRHGRSQDFFRGGEHFFKKIFKKFSKNIQKIFKKYSQKIPKKFKKFHKILKNIQKNFNKF